VRVEVEHGAPMPLGARVVARARYLGAEGRLHLFEVEAFDPGGRIGHGRHPRAVVEEARLLAGAEKRLD
jgi:fluoroacetyl-CoA thioesterase